MKRGALPLLREKKKKRRTSDREGRENNRTRQRGEKTRSLPPPSITAAQRRWESLAKEVENLMEEVEKVVGKRKSSLRREKREGRKRVGSSPLYIEVVWLLSMAGLTPNGNKNKIEGWFGQIRTGQTLSRTLGCLTTLKAEPFP
jgi:hypothetical protein